jgi:predicted Fe-Mo cluster-binding NifX family protein
MNHRLAIAIEEDGTQEKVAEHFGRCSKFNVCELDEQKKVVKKETHGNPLAGQHSGACQIPGYVKQFNVNTIIAGGMGQRAVANFHEYGIDVITAPGLLYEEAVNLFIQGKISGYQACSHEHENSNDCH